MKAGSSSLMQIEQAASPREEKKKLKKKGIVELNIVERKHGVLEGEKKRGKSELEMI